MIICRTIVVRIRNIPNAMATTKAVFIVPINGSVVIASFGCIQSAGMTSSKPKKLPNRKPKIVEKTPALLKHAASSIFLKW